MISVIRFLNDCCNVACVMCIVIWVPDADPALSGVLPPMNMNFRTFLHQSCRLFCEVSSKNPDGAIKNAFRLARATMNARSGACGTGCRSARRWHARIGAAPIATYMYMCR